MNNNYINEDIYNRYFGITKTDESTASAPRNIRNDVYENPKSATIHLEESVEDRNGYGSVSYQNVADDNIDDIEQLADILKRLCNAAWGPDWGELSPDLKEGENTSEVKLPQITVELNTRDISEGIGGLKPVLVDVVKEEDDNGNFTGDAFLIYRQWFDNIVEFNFYGRTNQEARRLKKKFETLIAVYTGYLKRNGISEIIFQQETSPRCSLYYSSNTPMRSVYYYVRFESITSIRQSLINSINLEIGANQVNADKIKTVIDNPERQDIIDFDFFDGDNGITMIDK
jgi:hypothetical protein